MKKLICLLIGICLLAGRPIWAAEDVSSSYKRKGFKSSEERQKRRAEREAKKEEERRKKQERRHRQRTELDKRRGLTTDNQKVRKEKLRKQYQDYKKYKATEQP